MRRERRERTGEAFKAYFAFGGTPSRPYALYRTVLHCVVSCWKLLNAGNSCALIQAPGCQRPGSNSCARFSIGSTDAQATLPGRDKNPTKASAAHLSYRSFGQMPQGP